MKKVVTILNICIMASMMSCKQQASIPYDEGIVINGVRWAKCNVNTPCSFTNKPEEGGMFYRWNNKKAWQAIGDFSDVDYYKPNYTEWEKVNNPCPAGWRLPTMKELESLCDTKKVTYKWTKRKGMSGLIFTDIATGNSIFLPAIGYRNVNGSSSSVIWKGTTGFYWSSTPRENNGEKDGVQFLHFDNRTATKSQGYGRDMFCIRCVAE